MAACCAPLRGWVLGWWTDGQRRAVAVAATNWRDDVAVLVVSVLCRGQAIPVAWQVVATTPNAPAPARDWWTEAILALRWQVQPAIPSTMPVLVLVDRG